LHPEGRGWFWLTPIRTFVALAGGDIDAILNNGRSEEAVKDAVVVASRNKFLIRLIKGNRINAFKYEKGSRQQKARLAAPGTRRRAI
jgi:hypothetical protein